MRRFRSVSVMALMAVLLPTASAGQEADGGSGGTILLDTLKVEGETGGYVVKRSGTATKTDTPLIEVPQSVTVVPAGQIRDQASSNLQEALRYTVGVRNEMYGIDNRGDWVGIRGTESTVKYLDGLRMPLAGWWGVMRDEPYAFQQIDILRGPSSIVAGANDPGGVINYVSKRPQAERSGEIGAQFGNYDHKQIMLDMTGPLDAEGTWLYRFVGLGKDSDTQINYADDRRVLVAPSITWRPNALGELTLFFEYQYDRSKNTNAFLGLAGTLLSAPNGPIPRDLFISEPDWDRYGGERYRFGYSGQLHVAENWQLRSTLRHDRVDGILKTAYAAWFGGFLDASGSPDPNGQYLGRLSYGNEDSVRLTAGDLLLEGKLRTGGIAHTLLLGVDGLIHESRQLDSTSDLGLINVYNPVYGTLPEPSFAGATPLDAEIRRVGVLVQDQIKLFDKLALRLGVRWDSIRNDTAGSPVQEDTATSVNVGVVYEVLPGLAPYVSYSQSFDPVAGVDFFKRPFEPKRGEQLEGGLKWEHQALPLQATASVFSITESNRLVDDPDPAHVGEQVQIGEAKIKGLELELKGRVAHTDVIAGYSYVRVRASAAAFGGNVSPDHQIEGMPEHQASVWAVHDLGSVGLDGFSIGGGVRFIGRVPDGTGNVSVPAVWLGDLMAAYETEHWRLAINANNVTDEDYIAVCLARGDCWFGQRRRVIGTLTWKF